MGVGQKLPWGKDITLKTLDKHLPFLLQVFISVDASSNIILSTRPLSMVVHFNLVYSLGFTVIISSCLNLLWFVKELLIHFNAW